MDLILEEITIRLEAKDARHISAAEGYITLGMYQEADAELEQIDVGTETESLLLKLCIYTGMEQWDYVRPLVGQIVEKEAEDASWSVPKSRGA